MKAYIIVLPSLGQCISKCSWVGIKLVELFPCSGIAEDKRSIQTLAGIYKAYYVYIWTLLVADVVITSYCAVDRWLSTRINIIKHATKSIIYSRIREFAQRRFKKRNRTVLALSSCKDRVQFKIETLKIRRRGSHMLHNTQVISRCCFAGDGSELYVPRRIHARANHCSAAH